MNRYTIPLAAFFLLVILLGIGLTINPRLVPSPFVGKAAPDFKLTVLNHSDQTYTPVNFRGEVWAVNVWASWCAQCRHEHRQLFELAQNLKLVGMNKEDKAKDATRWLTELGNPYHMVLVDPAGKAGLDWGVYGVPETFIIDKKGIIRYKHIGPISHEDLREKILPLVKQIQAEAAS